MEVEVDLFRVVSWAPTVGERWRLGCCGSVKSRLLPWERGTLIEGSLEVKLPTIWRDGKAEVGRVREEKSRSQEVRRSEKRKTEKQEEAGAWKGRKVALHCVFFPWFVAQEGRKVGLLKRQVRSQLARWEMKNCTPLWCEAHFQVKMYKTHQRRTTFGSWAVEKVHAVVARSTFPSQKCKKKTEGFAPFLTFRCGKSGDWLT